MAEVQLLIAGHPYTLGCAEGEQDRLEQLGRLVDEKLRESTDPGALNEVRSLLYASIFLADELADLREKASATPPEPGPSQGDEGAASALENLADRMEKLASDLEKPSESS